jgi:hypothetical protein
MAVTITNDAATTRTNLGLGDAATKTIGTASGNIPLVSSLKTVGGSSIIGSGDISTLPSGGTANQVLTSDASSNATWADAAAAGKVLQVYTYMNSTRMAGLNTSVSWNNLWGSSFTKQSSTSTLIITTNTSCWGAYSGETSQKFRVGTSTSNLQVLTYIANYSKTVTGLFIISGNTQTGSLNWYYDWKQTPCNVINPTSADHSSFSEGSSSTTTIMEVEA